MPDSGGFTVSPVKAPGPGPVGITNLGSSPVTFSLQPVATTMSGKFCAPTSAPVPWFHVQKSVTVPAGKTISLPVSVSGQHQTTDIAVKVTPVAASHGLGISYIAYAQEVIGQTGTSGCTAIKGIQAPKASTTVPTASAPTGHGGGISALDIAGLMLAIVLVLGIVLRCTVFRSRKGAHRAFRA